MQKLSSIYRAFLALMAKKPELKGNWGTRVRQEVIELGRLGPLPPSDVVVRENLDGLIDKYSQLLMSIEKPVTDEEARVLVKLFGPDDGFGLVWPLVSLVESAPGWPLADCLENIDNEWIRLLRQRVRNASSN